MYLEEKKKHWSVLKCLQITNTGSCGEKELSYTVCGNINL